MSFPTREGLMESGVGWLGAIPSNWQVLPAKALFSNRTVKAFTGDVHLTPSQKYGVLPQTEYMEITGARVVLNLTDSGQMKHVEPGDFVSHLRSFQGGLELARTSGKVSGAYTVLVPRQDQHPDYWRYALKSDTYIQALQTTTDQLRDGQSIRMKEFSLIRLPLVPLDEQKAIADFLDRELAQIDTLIQKQYELRLLLTDLRAALIEKIITESEPGHDSAVANGWYTGTGRPLSAFFKEVDFRVGKDEIPELLSVSQTRGIVPFSEISDKPPRADSFEKYKLVRQGDLVLNRFNAYRGALGVVKGPGMVSPDYVVLRPRNVQSDYFDFWFRTNQVSNCVKATMGGIGSSDPDSSGFSRMDIRAILKLKVHVDDENSRVTFASTLSSKLLQISNLTASLEVFQFALKERRQALISAAVTGKIDVRKVP